MASVAEAQVILRALGMPVAQQNEISALTFLALCGLGPDNAWSTANRGSMTISKGIMHFIRERHQVIYAPNTRETVRRQVLHQFVHAGIAEYNPDAPDLPTNSPRAHYAITDAALEVAQSYGTDRWNAALSRFISERGTLLELYQFPRGCLMVPVRLPDGRSVTLSPGKHNQVQRAVVEQFAPRFAPGSTLLYLGDTAKKHLVVESAVLTSLGVPLTEHDKLPDVMLFEPDRRWLFLIEAVTSHGPMTPKRIVELRQMLIGCSAGLVFVSAFSDFVEFRRHLRAIAWETEVWIADIPDHLIHYNGDRFLGPR